MDFYEKYTQFTDEQLLDVLKKRKDYQDSAIKAAVRIAIERQMIHSEQDLNSPEFQHSGSNGSRLFPEISNDFQRQKLIGSIFRFLYVLSFLPIIFGFLKYAEGELYLTFIGIGTGVIWFLLSFLLFKTRNRLIFIPLFVLLISISLSIGWKLIPGSDSIHLLDLTVLLIGSLLPLYLLLLLRWLFTANTKTT